MIRTLVRVPFARVTRMRRGWVPVIGWSTLAIALAIFSHTGGQTSGASHVLRGPFGYVILPLLSYGIVGAALGGVGLRAAGRGLVALGAEPERAALASVIVAMVSSAVASAALGVVVCVLAHGRGDPSLLWDVPATFGVALFGGAAYGAFFCAGSAIGRGAMRATFLALDWFVGAPAGFGAIFVPRGHVTSLLGGPACFDLSRRTSSVMLVVLLVLYLAMAVRLGRRVR